MGERAEARIDTKCPTFSWTASSEARGYELLVYEVSDPRGGRKPADDPVLRRRLPAGASSWTPTLEGCLAPGRYGWAVGAILEPAAEKEIIRWSQPALVRVEPSAAAGEAPRRPSRAPAERRSVPAAAPPAGSGSAARPRALAGDAYAPPNCASNGEMFIDVPASDPFCRWIELVAKAGIAESCDGGADYCPDNPVTRKQLAMALGRVMYGTDKWAPPQGVNPVSPPADNVVTPVDTAGNVGPFTSIAIGADGLPVISYIDEDAGALKVAHCNDVACAGQDETLSTVDDPASNDIDFYTAIAIGADGFPIISYYDATDLALKVAHCDDVACSGGGETITTVDDPVDGHDVGFTSSIAIGRDGLPIISYQDLTEVGLKVAHCDDPACSGHNESITMVDSSNFVSTLGAYSSIAIGADGTPTVSYSASLQLRLIRCNSAACNGGASFQVPVNSTAGEYTALVFGVDLLPVIAFYDGVSPPFNQDLRVVRCNDPACANNDETANVVDTAGQVGQYLSMTIGADGLPVMSYYDATAGVLKLAHCNDGACSGQNEWITVVDDPGHAVGLFTAIAIGADGLPIISYYDQALGDLKVAHCANVYCAPFFHRR